MEAHFQLLEYMRRDITDSIEGVVSPVITLALDTKLPVTLNMFTTTLPNSNEAFQELIKKCATVSSVFNLFTLNQDYSITCRFSFFEQYQNVQVISYKPGLSNDFALTQRKLSKLSFHYNIPFSNLSFSVKQTTTKFVFNGTYNEFITDNGTNDRNFIIRNPILFKPLIPQPLFSSVSSAPSTPAGPSMPSSIQADNKGKLCHVMQ